MKKLSFTMENYLEAIYKLSKNNNGARVSDIAKMMGVSKASTNSAMSTLSDKGLIVNEKYKEVFLTPEGLKFSKLTCEKHEVIQNFFIDVLKIDANVADIDACAIEHVISNDSVNAMKQFLANKKTIG